MTYLSREPKVGSPEWWCVPLDRKHFPSGGFLITNDMKYRPFRASGKPHPVVWNRWDLRVLKNLPEGTLLAFNSGLIDTVELD